MVDVQWMAALTRAGHPCVINQPMMQEIKSRQLCLLRVLDGNVKLPSLLWWVAAYGRRFELSSGSEFAASLIVAVARSVQSASSISWSRSLVGGTVPRHIAAGLLAVNVACACLIPLHALRPQGVGIVQWQTMFLQSRLHASVPECRLSQELAQGMLDVLQAVCACSLDDVQSGCVAALEGICAVLLAERTVAAAAV
eukprot:TRINITY_DN10546_c0_g1_i1.p1 TRINITY_DN10546_c0_g1~~TRINITY_DN10546_c0_g1_i1.p1  ORF type:complete len:197 (-),score=17.42 TRINITY_DN10546_c0_g1_i1:416-1006(-)